MANTIPHSISLADAIALTSRFRLIRTPNLPLAETFDKNSVLALLAVPNATSFRIYLGQKADGNICSVLVAADALGNDLLPIVAGTTAATVDPALILEDAIRCPDACPPASPLNG